MGQQITEYFFYRWRYLLGYGFIVISVIALFLVAGFLIPGGLTHNEMNSAVTSRAITFSPSAFEAGSVINLPYHLLQRASMWALGVNQFSIKLPSLLLGVLSALGILLLLRTWFKQNVAVLTTILVIATGQFLFLAQNGTPGIVYIFTAIWLLYAAMMVSRQARFSSAWKMVLFGVAALSLYTPLSIYMLIALTSAIVLHPHLRFLVRQLSKLKIFFGTLFLLMIIAPLLYAVIRHPDIGLQLLGIPDHMPNLGTNIMQLFNQYFDFLLPNGTTLPMSPIYDLGSVLLILLGVYRLFTTKYTARSYIISIWVILLIPVLIFNPQYTSVTFVPVLLLLATGINLLLSYWYGIFPRNPYARIAGLVPLVVLIGGIVFSGVDRYTYGYQYNPEVKANFSNDLSLLNKQLRTNQDPTTLVVNPDESAFYRLVVERHKNVTLAQAPSTASSSTTIFSQAAFNAMKPATTPYRIVTSGQKDNADRFYIYKTTVK